MKFDIEYPIINPPSELKAATGVKWAYLAGDDGIGNTSASFITNDDRATPLVDIPAAGAIGTLWSDNPGFITPNGTAYFSQLLSADPAIKDVFDSYGKTMLLAFSACVGYEDAVTMPIMWIGSGTGGINSGIYIQNTLNVPGRISITMYSATDTPNFTGLSTRQFTDRFQITAIDITAPTAPVFESDLAHGMKVGDEVYLSRTDTTPIIDGMYTVTAVASTTSFSVTTASITSAGTQTGDLSPEAYIFVVIDGVSGTGNMHFMEMHGTVVKSGSEVDISGFNYAFEQSLSPKVSILSDRPAVNIASKGRFRRFLAVNYGAQSLLDAAPTMLTKIIPSLTASGLIPTKELLNG